MQEIGFLCSWLQICSLATGDLYPPKDQDHQIKIKIKDRDLCPSLFFSQALILDQSKPDESITFLVVEHGVKR